MKNCQTCKWWGDVHDRYSEVCNPYNPATYDPLSDEEVMKLYGYAVKTCKSPKVLFYQHPEKDGAAVCDGSQYTASLKTAEYFGCVQHAEKS